MLSIDYERELNEEQKAVVFAGDGPMLVIAGAGSGKTRTVTYRVAHLVEQGVPPEAILLATFTNKAAREMLHRVEDLLGVDLSRLWGGTFHHIGNLILRREARKIGYEPNYTILDREDQRDLLALCVEELGIDPTKRRFPSPEVLANVITLSRNTLRSLEDIIEAYCPSFLDWASHIAHLFTIYQERKRRLNVMDYDDLLVYVYELLRSDDRVRRKYGESFRYILVDEYQDTNLLQAEIVDLLAEVHRNLLVVGDDAQSIYAFRGANFANILDFPKRYPDCRIFRLETNYRSTPEILNLANNIIVHNTRQFSKVLRPIRKKGQKPLVVALRDVLEQADFVATKVLELRDWGYSLDDIAVLYRAHYQSMEIQMEFTRRGIPFEVRSGLRFFEQAHIKDVVAHLRLIVNPYDEIAWKRVLRLYPGIGRQTAERVWRVVVEAEDPIFALERPDVLLSLPSGARESVAGVQKLLLRLESLEYDPALAIAAVLDGGYQEYLLSRYPNAKDRLEDLEELARFATRYRSLEAFLSELALLGSMEGESILAGGPTDEKVVLSTIHQAKGLEWACVFVVWLCEGAFPSPQSVNTLEDLEEERRLFYVACTRAKDCLFLCYPVIGERLRGRVTVRKRSRFLQELSPSLYEEYNAKRRDC
ncbi:ATP-dependent helicase [Candidatus Caldatribacterium sp.]|uniref:ATP-dependent helicase n=1 Tax=Candidatus Caldatribacterium sp. TaxID=2282143 RepID=UPI002995EF1B|nr:ATP-dependent helicase [Candidatus Caldatribacterium sp.]MDW8081339.1 ATP-dependent helicase [Candidatus Calescibacterium sp.]